MSSKRQRRPFVSIGMLMRRFSRALTQRYLGDAPLPEPEPEISDELPEAPATPTRPVARPVASSIDEAIRAAERPTPRPAAPRPVAPKPAPPKPVAPTVQPAPPAPAPVQRAPEPPAPAAPQPVTASGDNWPEGVPRTWNGQPIPVSNTPTPPALKAWIQREREREIRRDSLKGDDPTPPVQRQFDLALDSGGTPPSAPREPSHQADRPSGEDDDDTSTAVDSATYASALDTAIQRAESLDRPDADMDEAPARQ
ncbi:MAG: hypothetical protein MUC99_06695, partial [Anaerolineae bacterium]|nr:hypothetical protein [Anaerolineae bacterium]